MKPITFLAGIAGLTALRAYSNPQRCEKYKEALNAETNRENKRTAVVQSHYGPDPLSQTGQALGMKAGGVSYPAGFPGYWRARARRFGIPTHQAKTQLCGNCSAFDISPSARRCGVASPLNMHVPCAKGGPPKQTSAKGYCLAWRFQCSALRTCDSWSPGGPHTR